VPVTKDDTDVHEAPSSNVAAFFDIDNTLMQGASIYHLARGLFARKILSASDLADYALVQGRFLLAGSSESVADLAKITESALAFVAGRTTEELESLCEEIYDEIMADKVWPGTVQLAHEHLEAGHRVWLVSAAPIELARVIATKLGLDGAVATTSEIVDGIYTGKLTSVPMHGAAKAEALHVLAREHGFDLAASYAYSDSSNDIPLLTMVGHPTAINPDSALRKYAERNDWPIRDFRRSKLRKNYTITASATALALLGAGAGMAIAASRRSRAEKNI